MKVTGAETQYVLGLLGPVAPQQLHLKIWERWVSKGGSNVLSGIVTVTFISLEYLRGEY